MYNVKPTTNRHIPACGAACMVSFLDYYGVHVTMEEMIKECNVSISGSTCKDLMDAARGRGLTDIKAFKMDGDEVARQDRPSIIWWKFNHWCVCCGMDGDKVYICNPNRGLFGMSKETFKAFYSGVVIFNGEPHELLQEE